MNQNRTSIKKHKTLAAGLAAAVLLTSTTAVVPDTAYASGVLTCTQQEHTHSSSCYSTTQTLICGQAEGEEHTHGDACYSTSQILTCTIPEHTHSAACYSSVTTEGTETTEKSQSTETDATEKSEENGATESAVDATEEPETEETEEETEELEPGDPTADVESASYWTKTFADVELTGVYADDLLAIAKTQLGYTESTRNFVYIDQDGEKVRKGYTRYGAWYGAPYMDWCAMFVAFCLNYAEVSPEDMPRYSNCQTWINSLSYMDLYETCESDYEPIPGDLVFFEWDGDTVSDHIGIVYEVTKDTEGHVTSITTIEGNASNMVCTKVYSTDNTDIMGYGKLPQGENYTQTVEIGQLVVTAEYTGHAGLADTTLYAETVDENDRLFQSAEEEYEDAQEAKAEDESAAGVSGSASETSEEKGTSGKASSGKTSTDNEASSEDDGKSSEIDNLAYLLKIGFRDNDGNDVVPEEKVTYTISFKGEEDADKDSSDSDKANTDEETDSSDSDRAHADEDTDASEKTDMDASEEASEEDIWQDVDAEGTSGKTDSDSSDETNPDFYIITNPELADKDQPSTEDAKKDGYDTLDFEQKAQETTPKAKFESDTSVMIATNEAGSIQAEVTGSGTVPNTVAECIQDDSVASTEETEETELLYLRYCNQKKPK